MMTDLATNCRRIAEAAKEAGRRLATSTGAQRNAALLAMADSMLNARTSILESNALDVDAARKAGVAESRVDRLRLDDKRLQSMANAVREIAALPDPIG